MMFYISGTTDAGIKKPINQDSILVQKMETSIGQTVFACICDGMGGLQHGELASATVLYEFKKWGAESLPLLTNNLISRNVLIEQWKNIINTCNERIMLYGQNEGISLGTTLTAMLFAKNEYYIVNVGDSRAYEIGEKLRQLTHDHTFVQQEVDCGRMTAEEAKTSNKKHILTQCIGVNPVINPDFFFGKIKKNTIYMLCSDGFRHRVYEDEFIMNFNAGMINSSDALKGKEEFLVELNKERCELDNISVITVLAK